MAGLALAQLDPCDALSGVGIRDGHGELLVPSEDGRQHEGGGGFSTATLR